MFFLRARIFLISALIILPVFAHAYPEFIGYGYSSCLTCHVNGLGNGPLNDYGRALWSAEIASRWLYPKSMSNEDIANQSGFVGKPERLPYWLRPHIKYRELQLTTGYKSKTEAWTNYKMQEDIGLTVANESGKIAAVVTFGRVQTNRKPRTEEFIAREYYVRWQALDNLWVYAGLLEKVFGIRSIDHNSYQRNPQGFNPKLNSSAGNAQSQGLIVHRVEEKWELTGNLFGGNPYEDTAYRQNGASVMGEIEVAEMGRAGASALAAKSDNDQKEIFAAHYRQGLGNGHALMFEYGYIQDKLGTNDQTKGSYNLLQSNVNITRGYNVRAVAERYNAEFKSSSPDSWRMSFGLLAFPAPRFELRIDLVNGRSFYEGPAGKDSWTLQGQLHVSL